MELFTKPCKEFFSLLSSSKYLSLPGISLKIVLVVHVSIDLFCCLRIKLLVPPVCFYCFKCAIFIYLLCFYLCMYFILNAMRLSMHMICVCMYVYFVTIDMLICYLCMFSHVLLPKHRTTL